MKNAFETGCSAVDRMGKLQITGNIIPVAWYQTIRKETGKPNLNAIIILADIVYWYRPIEVRDEATGQLIGFRKRFHADMLQRSYQQFSEQFGLTKRDVTNAVIELEKLGVIQRVFRTIEKGGRLIPNVLFLSLDVDVLERLTYPETQENHAPEKPGWGCPRFQGDVSPKSGRYPTQMGEPLSLKAERDLSKIGETNTEITYKEYSGEPNILSIESARELVKMQIDYVALKHDEPYDERIDEILGIMTDIMTSTAEYIRVNKEDKPAAAVKAQYAKLTKMHVEYVLHCMDGNKTKARNIRALLVTALYNSVNTMGCYYKNLYLYHQSGWGMEDMGEKKGGSQSKEH